MVFNSTGPMLAFHCPTGGSGESHCVYIDGENKLIRDPVDEGHGDSLPISLETFAKLRIGKIDALCEIQRFRMKKVKGANECTHAKKYEQCVEDNVVAAGEEGGKLQRPRS